MDFQFWGPETQSADACTDCDLITEDTLPPDLKETPDSLDAEATELPDGTDATSPDTAADTVAEDTPVDTVPEVQEPVDTIQYEAPDGLEVVFFDVDQGDAALFRFPGGSTMLIDGGSDGWGYDTILPYMQSIHLSRLDYVVISHAHSDHCGGLDEVVSEVAVGEFWENGQTSGSTQWTDLSAAVDKKKIPRETVSRGYQTDVDGCSVQVLNADEGWGDYNADSIVLSIDCEGITVLMTGDITAGSQQYILEESGAKLRSDVVKVPHHGSPDYYPDFVTKVAARMAVCSVGAGNPYGHPSPDAVQAWKDAGAKFFRTDEDSTVTLKAKNGAMSATTSN